MIVRAGEVDWIARYAEMVAGAEAQAGPRPEDRWQGRAARFDRMSRADGALSAAVEGIAAHVRQTDVVIDVGAGTGRHAVPLARRCARVVALEPSPSMRERLRARLLDERLENVEVRAAAWPDGVADVGVADVVFSAHVIYGVADVAPFLEAMTARARRTCALLLKPRAPADALGAVYAALHARSRPRRPGALEALAVLHQLGRAAALSLVEGSARAMTFADGDDDLRELAARLDVPGDADGLARVRAALERVAERTSDGFCVGDTGATACITWPGEAERAG